MSIGIYKITTPSGKIYIGQSWNIKKRWACYKYVQHAKQTYLYHSFKKHGIENCKFEIIHELDTTTEQKVLDSYECLYMLLYRMLGHKLLNLREGGSRGKLSEESKIKLSKVKKGKIHSGSFKKGHKLSSEVEARRCLALKGRPSNMKGKKMPREAVEKIRQKKLGVPINEKKIIDIATGTVYRSINCAAEAIGVKSTTLGARLRGQCKNKTTLRYAYGL